jgi:tetratricopeptide (TPR) repeat protein
LAKPEPLSHPDESTQRQLDAALAAQQAGRLAEAIARYEAVIAKHPDIFDALHMSGVAHYQRGDFERALELVTSALRVSPSDRPARYNLTLIEAVRAPPSRD